MRNTKGINRKMKQCEQCEKILEDHAKFCNACGSSQNSTIKDSTLSKNKKWWIPISSLGSFLIAFIITSFLLENKEEYTIPTDEIDIIEKVQEQIEEGVEIEEEQVEVEEWVEIEEEQVEIEIEELEPELALGVDMSNMERKQLAITNASASSILPTWQHKTYVPNNTLDGDTGTAWVENASGMGIGEWIEYYFSSTEVVQEIQFYNGYGAVFDTNGVLSKVAISLSGGETFLYSVGGHWNTLVLPYALETTSVRLTIVEAYTNQHQDTCISETVIYNKSNENPTPQIDN